MSLLKNPHVRSIRFKLGLVFFIFGMIMVASIYGIMLSVITRMEEALIADRLIADIHYIEDLIGHGDWNVRGNAIYLGNTMVGDGTEDHANFEPFLEHERKTGTFSYVFIKCGDEGLGRVEDTPNQKGYMQGHYLRVAGSTRDPNGKSIVGTYIQKEVADILDAKDTYGGEANVAGGMIYCRYNTLKDRDGKVVGGIVVGRNISELQQQINGVIRTMAINVILALLLLGILSFFLANRWISIIGRVVNYLKIIELGKIPDEPLSAHSADEMGTLVTGINLMVDSLREKEALRRKSETDQLTGLANRFGLNRYFEDIFERCYQEKIPLTVGIMDIDFFKLFNDNYGHHAGDECVVALADILKGLQERGHVFCARFGCDEFIIICDGLERKAVEEIAQEIKEAMYRRNMPHAWSKISDRVTVSQGYCWGVPLQYKKLNDYIYIADSAMYDVKDTTKNGFKVAEMTEEFRPTTTENGVR